MSLKVLLFSAVISSVTAIENKRPTFSRKSIKELGDDIRDRRNLEYSLTLPHSHVASFRSLQRRTPGDLYQNRPGYGYSRRNRPYLQTPLDTVMMDPMVQYSQRDPLYDSNGDNLDERVNKNQIQAQSKILSIGDQLGDHTYLSESGHSYQRPHGPVLLPYYEHPEPIIEIIIKESNESLPAPPVEPVPASRPKDPIQVFYVKYQKDPNGGEEDVIYDKPIPAITPPTNAENDRHIEYTTVPPEVLTLPPPPSTTLRAIIKPESEHYHSNSGIKITFGSEEHGHKHEHSAEGHEESAPQASVALPHSPPSPPKQHVQQHQATHNSHFQKRQQVVPRDTQSFTPQTFQHPPNFKSGPQQRIQTQGSSFPAPHQQLPLQNSPNQSFRSSQQSSFPRLPNAPLFNAPQQSPQLIHNTPPPPTVQSLPAISHPGQPAFRSQPNFQQRPPIPHNSNPGRNQFRQNPQRPFHQGPQSQQFQQFNEHEYLQKNYHTITTEQLEPTRDQQLPNKPTVNFRDNPRPQVQAPFAISQEEYNKRYYEQLQYFKQQEQLRNRQRPPPSQSQPAQGPKFQQPEPPKPVKNNQQFNLVQNNRIPNPSPSVVQIPQKHQQLPQPVPTQQFQNQQQHQQQQHQQQHQQQQQQHQQQQQQHQQILGSQFLPAGGEVVASVPKYEQHLLVTPQPQITNIQHSQSQIQHSQSQHTQTRVSSNVQHQQSQIQHSQSQPQPLPQPSPLVQHFSQSPIRQEERGNGVQNNQISPIITSDFISVFEQNQREILELQEKLRKSEEEQQKLLALTQAQLSSTPFPDERLRNHNQFSGQKQSAQQEQRNSNVFIQNSQSIPYVAHSTNRPPLISSTGRPNSIESTTSNNYVSSTAKSNVEKSEVKKSEKNKKPVHFELPDEVPDDLRKQLLESGILENAQISVLDYDKVGDIPLESLPPDQLANFYNAGGGLQIAGSSPVQTVVKATGEKVIETEDEYDREASASENKKRYVDPYEKKKNVEMKVVHFDPSTAKGQQVAEKYVQDGAKQVDPVSLHDQKYNRYLPLKVSGANFPLPDVPELAGRKVTSVVVLAPVNYDFTKSESDNGRSERAAPNKNEVNFVAGDALKRLVKTPTLDNYKKWLEKEKNTSPDLQSVVLLVTSAKNSEEKQKEIFMYDVITQKVSKLSGELSNAFVDVAETNAHSKDFDRITVADSGTVESSIKVVEEKIQPPKPTPKENKYINHKPVYSEVEPKKHIIPDKKDIKPRVPDYGTKYSVEYSTTPRIESRKDSSEAFYSVDDKQSNVNHVLISSGYSRMKMGRAIDEDEGERTDE